MLIGGIYKIHNKKINVKSQVHNPYQNLIKPKKLGTRNIFIDKKGNKELVIYFTIYYPDKSITMLNLYCDEFIEIIEEHKGKKILDG